MFAAERLPYSQTNLFSRIIIEYLDKNEHILPFINQFPNKEGFKKLIEQKKNQKVNREVLVNVLMDQYKQVPLNEKVHANIQLLKKETCFSVTTAHQPNLLTGPLYFIYKILHVIKLAESLKKQFSACQFVPVYYMGNEDADFAELNHFTVHGKEYAWNTDQKGAVGRMIIDKKLITLIDELEQQISVEPHGAEFIEILRSCYKIGESIQLATFRIVHHLFNKYGLIVLIADDARLKSQMKKVFEDDLFYQKPSEIVEASCKKLAEHYNVQANPREINLFYLKDNSRERIEKENDEFKVLNTDIRFTVNELKEELDKHPERFSPNVILRGLFQESILPNISFIGGSGELAYWLQLKDLFQHYSVVFPVLILRNSFVVVDAKWQARMKRLGLTVTDLFMTEAQIMRKIVQKFSDKPVSLNGKFEKAELLFEEIRQQAELIDPTLSQHITSIKTQSIKLLHELEKKMLRAEKRKFTDQQRQTFKIKHVLFPKNGLQERVENICTFYPKWGSRFIDQLHANSLSTEQLFTILIDQNS